MFKRSIRPNENDPATVQPATVGPDVARPGDPNGVVIEPGTPAEPPFQIPPPMPWSGWPAGWATSWGPVQTLTDTAWTCLDLNSSVLSTMPPYLVDAADSLDSDWLRNPDPDVYTSWEEFAKQAFWEFQMGEVFVLATAYYATGWPARFHVVTGAFVDVDFDDTGRRRYSIGQQDVSADMLQIRYQSSVDDAHGHGPLEAGASRLVAAEVLSRYATTIVQAGGIPSSILTHPEELTADQAFNLQQQWVAARVSTLGEPAVLSGGVTWEATQLNPQEMALLELSQWNESRIAIMLGVPPFLVGLPSGGDSYTYSNVSALFDYHWRAGLRPKAQTVMSALSEWLLPRGTSIELNRDAYIRPEPYQRAQTYQILNAIKDEQGNPALTVDEIRKAEQIENLTSNAWG